MKDLYNPSMESALQKKLNARWCVLGVVCGALLAVLVFSMVIRLEWLSMVSVICIGFFAIFWIELFCLPLIRYRRLIRSALNGRSHTVTLEYQRTEPDDSMVDGVRCVGMVFLGEPDKHGSREQLLYWDRQLEPPVLQPGQTVEVRYTDKNIIGI